jgi:ribosome-binding protein aMBF1 (putative translation factor)
MRGSTLVREARRRAGLSQADLAARVQTTQSAIARLESGATAPSLERVTELVRACGFDLEVQLVPRDDAAVAAARRNRRLTPEERLQKATDVTAFINRGRRAVAAASRG